MNDRCSCLDFHKTHSVISNERARPLSIHRSKLDNYDWQGVNKRSSGKKASNKHRQGIMFTNPFTAPYDPDLHMYS